MIEGIRIKSVASFGADQQTIDGLSKQMAEHFDSVRAWIAELNALPHYRVERGEIA